MNLEAETICGCYVSAEQKKINAVYLDLLTEFGRLCQRAGIPWWMYGGSLIGAVRHKGFIPWDDDVDLLMPRADFDRLQDMTNEEFGAAAPYFLQNFRTDPTCAQSLIRFRRSDTADIRDYDLSYCRVNPGKPAYNMGINLAVFPLDAVPQSALRLKFQARAAYALRGIFYRATCPDRNRPAQHLACAAVYRVLGGVGMMKLMHRLYRAPRRVRGDVVQSFEGLYGSMRLIWPKSDFAETVFLPFEDIEVPAPAGYDDLLRTTYGDYMQFPPEAQRTAPHGGHPYADRPYAEVLAELLAQS